MRYPRLARFTAPARPAAGLWRTALGGALIVVLSTGAVFGALGLIGALTGPLRFAQIAASMVRAGTPQGLMMVLATFAPMALAVIVVTRALHGRSAQTLFGPGATRDFIRVAKPLMALALLLWLLSLNDANVARSTPPWVLLAWLPLALPLLAVQIGAEELIFRGYLLQQLSARSRSPTLWMVLPSALFGALHYAPGQNGAAALWIALWATAFGLFAADLTARAGNLGPALAFHLTNNITAMFLVGLYGQLDGLSLFTIVINLRDMGEVAPYLAIDSLSMLTAWLLARLTLRL